MVLIFYVEVIHQQMNTFVNNINQAEVHHRNHLVIMDLEVNVHHIYLLVG